MAIWLTVYGLRALGKEVNSVELVRRTGITRQGIAEICSVLVEHGFLERYTVGSVHPTRSGYYYAVPQGCSKRCTSRSRSPLNLCPGDISATLVAAPAAGLAGSLYSAWLLAP